MATRFVAAKAVQAIEEAKSEIIEGVGVKLESFMTGTTEQPDNMDDVQWRNYNLSVARAAQSNANEAKKRIDAQKYAEKMAKLSDQERERRMRLEKDIAEQRLADYEETLKAKAAAKAAAKQLAQATSTPSPE